MRQNWRWVQFFAPVDCILLGNQNFTEKELIAMRNIYLINNQMNTEELLI